MTPRILVYSHLDEPLFELDPSKLFGLKMVEKVNGEHSLTITTEQELEKGQRIFYHDGEKLREFVVVGDTATRQDWFSHEYYCVWSLQNDLSGDYIEDRRIGNKNDLRGATDILTAIAENSRWQVGTVDSTSLSSAWLYYKSCWDCLGVAVENWSGEVDSTIVLGDPIVRRIDFYDKLGDQEVKRRFDYGYDLTSVKRTVLDDLYVCRIVPRGKGEAVEGEGGEVSGYGRRITIESANPTGEEWIQDNDAAALVRLPDGNGGYTYPTQIVIYESIETPETLYETALADLETYTRPKVSYEASVLALSGAGMDAQGVELGDAVQIVDRTFGEDGLRISARVMGIERDLLDPSKDALTVGNFQHLLSDTIKKLEDGLSAAQEQLIDTDGKAEASMGIAETAQQVATAVNQHFWTDTQGAHVTEVTKDEWNDSTGPLYQSGANSLWNSLGMLFRKGLTNLMALVVDDPDDEVLGETGVAIYDGQGNATANIVASFTNDGVTLGKGDESHAELDYHSLRLIDKEGNAYFYVSDLRDESGTAQVTNNYVGDGTKTWFELTHTAATTDYSVTVDGVEVTSGITKESWRIVFDTAPSDGAAIVVSYTSASEYLKAYTIGTRGSGMVGGLSVAEGFNTVSSSTGSHAEGWASTASALASHAEGYGAVASGEESHAEGLNTVASGWASHAEGDGTQATGDHGAHAEGWQTSAAAPFSHAEGLSTRAEGVQGSHAEGIGTLASGVASHAQNSGTIAAGDAQTALGKYNISDTTSAVIIGNGTSSTNRKNALTIGWSGSVDAAGRVTGVGLTSTNGAQITSWTEVRSTNISLASPPASGETAGDGSFSFYDKDGNYLGTVFPIVSSNGNVGLSFQVRRTVNGTNYYNWLRLYIDSSGNPIVTVQNDAAKTAWRNALNVVSATDQSRQNARFINLTGITQIFGLFAKCINTNNTTYNGKDVGVIFDSGRMTLWNNTAQSTIWQLNNLSGSIDLGTTAWATLTTGVTYRRHRGFVVVKFNNYSYTGSGTEVAIGTLAAGYRPDGLFYSALFNTSVGTTQVPYVSIATDGTVRVNGRASGAKVYGEAVFPV